MAVAAEVPSTPKTALVLCGGGSGGAVEVGLYKALVELGIDVDFVVGSSIGAVNGALIAAGLSPGEVAAHWRTLRRRDLVGPRWQLLRLLTGADSVFSNQRLRGLLRRRLPFCGFHELPLPLAIVATDLETGETIVLEEGDLVEAVLASTALPGIFPSVLWQKRRLVDGGLSNNLPIDVAVEKGAERIFAIRCGCGGGLPRRPNLVSVLGQSFSVAINARVYRDVRRYQPQVELHIVDPCPGRTPALLDFDRAWTLIEPAYRHALVQLQAQLDVARAQVSEDHA